MLIPNQISEVVDQQTLDEVRDHVRAIKSALPFLVGVDPIERRNMLKVGDRSQGFIRKALDVGYQIEEHLPRSMDLEEMRKDVELMRQLYPVMIAVNQLSEKLADTYAIAASEAYSAALLVYRTGKQVRGSEGISKAMAELSQRFNRRNDGDDDGEPMPGADDEPGLEEPGTGVESLN